RDSIWCARSVFATSRTPEVSRSSRCTMPGRSSPPTPSRSRTWWSRALTSVPEGWPGAGCTTRPAGLSIARSWSSSYRIESGMASGVSSVVRGSGTSTVTDSPARTAWERLAGAPSTRTAPSWISLWRRERERSEQAAARKRSRRVPLAGAPTWKRRCMRRLFCLPLAAGQEEEHPAREQRAEQADELRGREPVPDDEAAHDVAPPDLQDAARHGRQQDVEPEDLAVERLAAVRPLEDQEDEERVQREIDLRRVERHVERGPDGVVRERVRERHAERSVGRPAVTTAGGEASPASDRLAQRDRGSAHVGDPPRRQVVLAHVPDRDRGRRDQPSVKDAARAQHLDEVPAH